MTFVQDQNNCSHIEALGGGVCYPLRPVFITTGIFTPDVIAMESNLYQLIYPLGLPSAAML